MIEMEMPISLLQRLYVLEYSKSQDAFHLHPLTDAVKTNLQMLLSGYSGDFVPVGLFVDPKNAAMVITRLRKMMKTEREGKIRSEELCKEN